MASQAFERAMKKLESPSETQLAELIMRDITQLSEDAKGEWAFCVPASCSTLVPFIGQKFGTRNTR